MTGNVPRIAPGFRLQFEPAQEAWVLLYPEGMVKLNGPASEILQRCNGNTSVEALTADLERSFGEPDLRADVDEFLADARLRGWIA
ncbi:pyrroloquinoline quinone biosynthesis peptide chaperone PqqD [Rivibacter subsaxonicus]|uniref:Pyrroloquinoline quinone biosynthesis protein D n=1 Tax=Rivibacter subsaxonicus TaxID=457575 RepID=A0A4Q7VNI4_9BURK|nr:pyrroloquinoline quinone biosynthesis peptide chaperone PqqD [Rivibacter subsaxonicus]RZT97872.1 pyrroloquinoline quinone biosynthesis protein D [Rivibacter subsaxonicus]